MRRAGRGDTSIRPRNACVPGVMGGARLLRVSCPRAGACAARSGVARLGDALAGSAPKRGGRRPGGGGGRKWSRWSPPRRKFRPRWWKRWGPRGAEIVRWRRVGPRRMGSGAAFGPTALFQDATTEAASVPLECRIRAVSRVADVTGVGVYTCWPTTWPGTWTGTSGEGGFNAGRTGADREGVRG
jgi:hypothetical protein